MECKRCNTTVAEGMQYCPQCGEKLEETIASGTEVVSEPVSVTGQEASERMAQDQTAQREAHSSFENQYQNQYRQAGKPINGTIYVVLSILATVLCCTPIGVASVFFAARIEPELQAGNYDKASENAKKARICIIAGIVVSIIVWFWWTPAIIEVLDYM